MTPRAELISAKLAKVEGMIGLMERKTQSKPHEAIRIIGMAQATPDFALAVQIARRTFLLEIKKMKQSEIHRRLGDMMIKMCPTCRMDFQNGGMGQGLPCKDDYVRYCLAELARQILAEKSR